jgi:hypothetical protein
MTDQPRRVGIRNGGCGAAAGLGNGQGKRHERRQAPEPQRNAARRGATRRDAVERRRRAGELEETMVGTAAGVRVKGSAQSW